ncbi:MAG: VOC family protein [Gammaproteobacteria bacterium]|nr:VOC family protein [Gammaproteobacteria bacterium]MBU1481708.1 VOC family protein [Gammaproteobacteria bacterium]
MKIPRMTVITLGVADLTRSTAFYREIFSTPPVTEHAGVTFIPLPGVWLSLYPLEKLAEDIGEEVKLPAPGTFHGVTLAYNARSKDEITSIFARVAEAGAHIAKAPQDTFWGGYSGYFSDPDGHYWEVAWGPMFDFTEHGDLRFKT